MVESDFFQNICRICANETNGILIFGEKGKESCLEESILKFLAIKVTLHDALPKVVCLSCKNKLSEIRTFVSMAQRTQEKLLASLGKPPPSDLTDDDIIDSIEDEDEPGSPCDESRGSLLHSILTNGGLNTVNSEDVTKLEVTLDPMLFLADDTEDDQDEAPSSPSHSDEEYKSSAPVSQMPPLVQLTPRTTSGLSNTMQYPSGKAYQCTLCYRGFLSDLGLQNHMWSHLPYPRRLSQQHHNVVPPEPKKCECGVCGRVYPTMSTLRAHQITHSNLRPHKCNLCDKTFKRNQDLKFHINQHTGERPYRCPYCPKAFASSGNCFSHRKRMHPKQLAKDKSKRLQRSNLSHN